MAPRIDADGRFFPAGRSLRPNTVCPQVVPAGFVSTDSVYAEDSTEDSAENRGATIDRAAPPAGMQPIAAAVLRAAALAWARSSQVR